MSASRIPPEKVFDLLKFTVGAYFVIGFGLAAFALIRERNWLQDRVQRAMSGYPLPPIVLRTVAAGSMVIGFVYMVLRWPLWLSGLFEEDDDDPSQEKFSYEDVCRKAKELQVPLRRQCWDKTDALFFTSNGELTDWEDPESVLDLDADDFAGKDWVLIEKGGIYDSCVRRGLLPWRPSK